MAKIPPQKSSGYTKIFMLNLRILKPVPTQVNHLVRICTTTCFHSELPAVAIQLILAEFPFVLTKVCYLGLFLSYGDTYPFIDPVFFVSF